MPASSSLRILSICTATTAQVTPGDSRRLQSLRFRFKRCLAPCCLSCTSTASGQSTAMHAATVRRMVLHITLLWRMGMSQAVRRRGIGAGEGTCARTQGGAWEGSSVAQVDVPGLKVTGAPLRSGGCARTRAHSCQSAFALQRCKHNNPLTQPKSRRSAASAQPALICEAHSREAMRTRPHAALWLCHTSKRNRQPCLQAQIRPAGRLGRLGAAVLALGLGGRLRLGQLAQRLRLLPAAAVLQRLAPTSANLVADITCDPTPQMPPSSLLDG